MKIYINTKPKYKPKGKFELMEMVEDLSIKLWEIDTSSITEMSYLFVRTKRKKNEDFEGIGLWDVSNVTSMSCMFSGCKNFNKPLNNWDVSKVKYMDSMFFDCKKFNQPLNNWDVSNVADFLYMFENCSKFNQDLNNWNIIDNAVNVGMFRNCLIKEDFKPDKLKQILH